MQDENKLFSLSLLTAIKKEETFMTQFRYFLFPILIFLLSACTYIPEVYPRTVSHATTSYQSTDIAKMMEREVAQHPGKSGFYVIRYGREAFTARIAMTDLTQSKP